MLHISKLLARNVTHFKFTTVNKSKIKEITKDNP